jgi:hypothetical protein
MSSMVNSKDEWKTVAPRRKGKRKVKYVRQGGSLSNKSAGNSVSYTKEEYETVIFDKVLLEKTSMLDTPFWNRIVQILGGVERMERTTSVVAYGMGSFETKNAIVQMGCLLNLVDYLRRRNESCSVAVEIFDPVMSELDVGLVEKLGFACVKENENCKRIAKESTLFFLPHGDIFMYGNLLETNIESDTLENIILVGNGLTNYIENASRLGSGLAFQNHQEETQLSLKSICKVREILVENVVHRHRIAPPKQQIRPGATGAKVEGDKQQQGISLDGNLERAFNDTSICTFARRKQQ